MTRQSPMTGPRLAALDSVILMATAACVAIVLTSEPPREFTATWDDEVVELAWTAPKSDAEILAYLLKRNPNWSHGAAVEVASTALTYRDQTATIGNDYTYALQAYYKDEGPGNPVSASTSYTSPAETTTAPATATTSAPATPTTAAPTSTPTPAELAPTSLTGTEQNNGIRLGWNEPTQDASSITGYQVLRRTPADDEQTLAVLATTSGRRVAYLDSTALTEGTQYVYRVKAVRGSAISNRSNYVNPTRQTQGTDPGNPTPTPVLTPMATAEPTFTPPAHIASVWWKYDTDSACGYVIAKLKRQRFWQCPSCTAIHDRNLNAAVNLRELLTLPADGGTMLRDG